MVATLLNLLVYLLILGLVFAVIWWIIGVLGLPEPINRVVRIIFAVVVVIVLISVLLGLLNGVGFPRLLR